MYCGVIGSSNSVAVGTPSSITSFKKLRAILSPSGISLVPSSFGSMIKPFQPTVVRGFSKYTRMTSSMRSFTSSASCAILLAYSLPASISWIEQGPTTMSNLGSSPKIILLIASRLSETNCALESVFSIASHSAVGDGSSVLEVIFISVTFFTSGQW